MHVVIVVNLNERPKLEDLNNNVVPWLAPQWQLLGAMLQIKDHLLKIIEHDYHKDCETCCSKMLSDWLDLNPTASWRGLLTALYTLYYGENKYMYTFLHIGLFYPSTALVSYVFIIQYGNTIYRDHGG